MNIAFVLESLFIFFFRNVSLGRAMIMINNNKKKKNRFFYDGFAEAQHPRHDRGGERGETSPGNGQSVLSREEVSSRGGAWRRCFRQKVRDAVF